MQNNDSHLPDRHSTRLPTYDYASTGAYFITICTDQRRPYFAAEEFHPLLSETWQNLPERFPQITLDEFVIMPDHIHFIVWLDGTNEHAVSLDRVVGAYKSLTAVAWIKYHKAKGLACSPHLWQSRYYDHIIRNDQDLDLTRQYIHNNPIKAQWP